MEPVSIIIDYEIKIQSLSPLTTLVILKSESTDLICMDKEDFIYYFQELYNRSNKGYVLFQTSYNCISYKIYIPYLIITNIIDDLMPLPIED